MKKRIKLIMLAIILPIIASLITIAIVYHDITYYSYIDMTSYSPFLEITFGLTTVASLVILLYVKIKKI